MNDIEKVLKYYNVIGDTSISDKLNNMVELSCLFKKVTDDVSKIEEGVKKRHEKRTLTPTQYKLYLTSLRKVKNYLNNINDPTPGYGEPD